MRLFIGSFATLDDYDSLRAFFAPHTEGKWVERHNLHLTWIFLGNVTHPDTLIERIGQTVLEPFSPLPLQNLGLFQNRPPTLFAKTDEHAARKLCRTVDSALNLEPRPRFMPHVTLLRVKRAPDTGWTTLLNTYDGCHLGAIEPRIRLIQSRLTPTGPHYTTLATFCH